MKKIISMGIASAVLALTAIAASADIKATTEDKVVNGKDITVQIVTTAKVEAFGFTVSASGLETTKEKVEAATGALSNIAADGSVMVSGYNVTGWDADSVLATITYTVTAETGADIAVVLDNMPGMDDAFENLPLKVVAEETSEPEPSQPESSDPSSEPEPSDPGKEDPKDPESPGTGVALAVVPAVLAGAAVVVAKKRK